jgi:hypoxanthine phosphoribosyltransferase
MNKLYIILKERNNKKINICFCIDKHKNYKVPVQLDYVVFSITGNDFLIGCGLDYDERYRNLPQIGKLDTKDL